MPEKLRVLAEQIVAAMNRRPKVGDMTNEYCVEIVLKHLRDAERARTSESAKLFLPLRKVLDDSKSIADPLQNRLAGFNECLDEITRYYRDRLFGDCDKGEGK